MFLRSCHLQYGLNCFLLFRLKDKTRITWTLVNPNRSVRFLFTVISADLDLAFSSRGMVNLNGGSVGLPHVVFRWVVLTIASKRTLSLLVLLDMLLLLGLELLLRLTLLLWLLLLSSIVTKVELALRLLVHFHRGLNLSRLLIIPTDLDLGFATRLEMDFDRSVLGFSHVILGRPCCSFLVLEFFLSLLSH